MGLGYFFMGIIAWVYDVFVRRGIILDEENLLNLESMRI
jgi:hypothetical protein